MGRMPAGHVPDVDAPVVHATERDTAGIGPVEQGPGTSPVDEAPGSTGRRLPVVRHTAIALACTTAVVLAATPATRAWARFRRESDPGYGDDIPLLFDINTEATVPTWYNAALLLAVACLCGLVGSLRRAARLDSGWRWMVLGAVFAAMSLDETVALHERLGPVASSALDVEEGGLLRHSWVIAGVVLAIAFGGVVAWAVVTLPRVLRRWMVVGLGVYVLGALVFEAASGAVLDRYGDGMAYTAVTLAEEGAEMAGAVILLCSLLAVLDVRSLDGGGIQVRPAGQPGPSSRWGSSSSNQ